jgi:paraquat-inducible protein A
MMEHASTLTICSQCDLVQAIQSNNAVDVAHCSRCGCHLAHRVDDKFEFALSLLIASAILLVTMNVFPLVEMRVNGNTRATTLIGAVQSLYSQGMVSLAILVLITTILSPAIEIGCLLMIVLSPKLQKLAPSIHHAVELIQKFHPWSMVEVFMLGVLVTLVKLAAFSDIILGPALWACAGIILTLATLKATIPMHQLWNWSVRGIK